MSSRTLTVAMQTAIAQSQYTTFLFVELDFTSGFLRLCTAGHDVTWNGFNWIGVGEIGSVDAITEDTALQANGYRLSLSGLDADIIEIAMQEDYQGRSCKMWFPLVDIATGAIIADPLLVVRARMDAMELQHGQHASVSLIVESELAAWDRPKVRRYNDPDQKAEFPTDRGFEFIARTAGQTLTWGKS